MSNTNCKSRLEVRCREAEMLYIAHAKVADTPGPGEEWSLSELE